MKSGLRFKLIFIIFILLVLKQTIPQKKARILRFLEQESLRAWHYQEGTTPFSASHGPMLFVASRHGALLITESKAELGKYFIFGMMGQVGVWL